MQVYFVWPATGHHTLRGWEETLNCHEKQLKSSVKENLLNDKMVDLKLFCNPNAEVNIAYGTFLSFSFITLALCEEALFVNLYR